MLSLSRTAAGAATHIALAQYNIACLLDHGPNIAGSEAEGQLIQAALVNLARALDVMCTIAMAEQTNHEFLPANQAEELQRQLRKFERRPGR